MVTSAAGMRPIADVARDLGIAAEHLEPYGRDKAKVRLEALEPASASKPAGKLVLVSAITPTPAGEGKTTTSIGLSQGLRKIGKHAAIALRQPSMGPVFGRKGGATGGGASRIEPSNAINLQFTGDFHAITAAHNLLAAAIDNQIHFGDTRLDPGRVLWKRSLDMNDRALRKIVLGLGGPNLGGVPRESGFDITAASEIMAILCLADSRADLRARIDRILVGYDRGGRPVHASEMRVSGAMMAILNEAICPNLVQSREGTPAFVHGGPFANIAHGCNSVLATRMALATARLRRHGSRVRVRPRRREVLRPEMPVGRVESGGGRDRGDDSRLEDARRNLARRPFASRSGGRGDAAWKTSARISTPHRGSASRWSSRSTSSVPTPTTNWSSSTGIARAGKSVCATADVFGAGARGRPNWPKRSSPPPMRPRRHTRRSILSNGRPRRRSTRSPARFMERRG